MTVEIKRATIEHLKTIQDFNHELFLHDFSSDPALNVDWPYQKKGEEYFKALIESESSVVFLAYDGKKIVGYLAGGISDSESYRPIKAAALENMLVEESSRSQGIGGKLVKEFVAWCKSKGVSRCAVQAYSPNERAIKFYENNGFKPFYLDLELNLDEL